MILSKQDLIVHHRIATSIPNDFGTNGETWSITNNHPHS